MLHVRESVYQLFGINTVTVLHMLSFCTEVHSCTYPLKTSLSVRKFESTINKCLYAIKKRFCKQPWIFLPFFRGHWACIFPLRMFTELLIRSECAGHFRRISVPPKELIILSWVTGVPSNLNPDWLCRGTVRVMRRVENQWSNTALDNWSVRGRAYPVFG